VDNIEAMECRDTRDERDHEFMAIHLRERANRYDAIAAAIRQEEDNG
jgi:hypothetical protein